jgi:SUMO ligase MMS21 Smc5/6 complex component
MEYIATQRRNSEAARCPRSGCDKQLSERTLKDDKELEKKVKAFTRRMEMRTESRRTQATQILD